MYKSTKNRRKIYTAEEISIRIKEIHGNRITLIESTYIKTHAKASFLLEDGTIWEAIVKNVLNGTKGPLKIVTPEILIARIKEKHGNIITPDLSTYTNTHTDMRFIDCDYGEWWSIPKEVMGGTGHPGRWEARRGKNNIIPIKEIKASLLKIHGESIVIDESTYIDASTKCTFIDKEYNKTWEAIPVHVLRGATNRKRGADKQKKTMRERHGYDFPNQNREIGLKAIRNANLKHIRTHWKTGEELICQGSWEPLAVEYLNKNKIDFLWQPKAFVVPKEIVLTLKGNQTTYRPDFYLVDQDIWVEIKGYFREESKKKWDWFKSVYPTAELWDKKKLKELGFKIR